MAKSLKDWVEHDVAAVRDRSLAWLSQEFFFRDPTRPTYSDTNYFFSPADGIVLYQLTVDPDEPIVDIKGKRYSLQDAMRHPSYDKRSIVIYLHNNQRMLNRVWAPDLGQSYYILQIADYDVDCIMPFQLKQNWPFMQNERFSVVRYGSQVDLIVPLSERFDFTPVFPSGVHVEGGLDPLLEVSPK
jgi:phosphatidylserine decarboxylase